MFVNNLFSSPSAASRFVMVHVDVVLASQDSFSLPLISSSLPTSKFVIPPAKLDHLSLATGLSLAVLNYSMPLFIGDMSLVYRLQHQSSHLKGFSKTSAILVPSLYSIS